MPTLKKNTETTCMCLQHFLCCQYFWEFEHYSAVRCLYRTGGCGQQSLPSSNQKTSLKLLSYLPSGWHIFQLQFYEFFMCFDYYHLMVSIWYLKIEIEIAQTSEIPAVCSFCVIKACELFSALSCKTYHLCVHYLCKIYFIKLEI